MNDDISLCRNARGICSDHHTNKAPIHIFVVISMARGKRKKKNDVVDEVRAYGGDTKSTAADVVEREAVAVDEETASERVHPARQTAFCRALAKRWVTERKCVRG